MVEQWVSTWIDTWTSGTLVWSLIYQAVSAWVGCWYTAMKRLGRMVLRWWRGTEKTEEVFWQVYLVFLWLVWLLVQQWVFVRVGGRDITIRSREGLGYWPSVGRLHDLVGMACACEGVSAGIARRVTTEDWLYWKLESGGGERAGSLPDVLTNEACGWTWGVCPREQRE